MHKNYNSCLHILDMHMKGGRHQFSHRKQILVFDWHVSCIFISSYILFSVSVQFAILFLVLHICICLIFSVNVTKPALS